MQDNNNNNNEVSRAERFENAHKRRRRRNKIWFVLACIVVFCTTYALILPAITLERPTYCGLEEHTHDASCYERVLTCGMAESAEHQHTDACYTEVLTCGKPEHTHTEACYVEPQQAAAKPDAAGDEEPLPNNETPATNDETPAANAEGEAISTAAELKSKLEAGGTYYLANDITISDKIEIPNGKTSVLNLNGHTVSYNSTESWYFILVRQGASLTINDDWTGTGAVTETSEYVTGTLYGQTGSLTDNEDGSKTLVYYVTESTPSGTTTTERLAKHTVVITPPSQTAGGITSTAASTRDALVRTDGGTIVINGGKYTNASHLIKGNNGSSTNITINGGYFTQATGEALYLNGGTMTINGGIVTGNTDGSNGGAGVYANSGTVKIIGGYIVGNTTNNGKNGGGVGINSGALNITGGVIAGNRSGGNGGGVYMGGTLDISGGVIAGNSCPNNGGGVGMRGGTLNISGGYITNNTVPNFQGSDGDGSNGGGGIFMDSGTVNISGGYVTGNYSENVGGGLFHRQGTFYMTGGTFASNCANRGEGGAMRLCSWNGSRVILTGRINAADPKNPIYITNNTTDTHYSWGGGGIFVADGGALTVMDSVITGNHAGGFGAGVSGCSTGRTYALEQDGSAIYGNKADGTNLTKSRAKPEDHYAAANDVFMNSGYQDFFCAMNSMVYDGMLGGGSANWNGSCDYQYIDIEERGSAAAGTMMGLTAHPNGTDTGKAEAAGKVFISGNNSYTHGGGIMSNGILMLGSARELEVTPGLTIYGHKNFTANGQRNAMAPEQFTFMLLSKAPTVENGKISYDPDSVVRTAVNDADGDFLFSMQYETPGTYTYYLVERPDDDGIKYDTAYYTITVNVRAETETLNTGSNTNVTTKYTLVNSVDVTCSDEARNVNVTKSNIGAKNHAGSVQIGTDGTATFTNDGTQPHYFRITKKDNFGHIMSGVKFTLTQGGNTIEPITSNEGKTNYAGVMTWRVEGGETYELAETETPEGYQPSGPWTIVVSDDGNTAIVTPQGGQDTQVDLNRQTYYFDYGIVNNAIPYELPKTGGAGTTAMYSLGALLILAAAVGAGYDLMHRRERRKH